ncbi:MAG: Rieske 2Fe-2S domain-containing protein [Luminiphilus sp.]|nr:Rieske 2Fe-2S domain-containing protein [Luminiphilus sp.]
MTPRQSPALLDDASAVARIFEHIDNGTTDLGDTMWREPVDHYHSQARFDAEMALLRRLPVPFCPSAALSEPGSYVARTAAGTPVLAVRDNAGQARAFINACRHRGMQVASGEGCTKTFSCPYHAWTYGLDGQLRGIPGEEGFPDVDKATHGLVPLSTCEAGGIVYVQQRGDIDPGQLGGALEYFSPEQRYFQNSEVVVDANWKLITETLLEGYHIKSLHTDTFYPFGFDNTNLVETFGANCRIIYPFKRMAALREVPAEKRKLNGMVTSVYHLFPNASVAVLSKHTSLTLMEPLSPTRTRLVSYYVVNPDTADAPITLEAAQRDVAFVNDSGQEEDRDAARAIQETLTTGANTHLTFGYFEKAIVNFHQHLAAHLD